MILTFTLESCYYVHGSIRMGKLRNIDCNCDTSFANVETNINKKHYSGRYVNYDNKGCIESKGRYFNGKKRGLWEFYFNGCLSSVTYFKRNDTLVWMTVNTSW